MGPSGIHHFTTSITLLSLINSFLHYLLLIPTRVKKLFCYHHRNLLHIDKECKAEGRGWGVANFWVTRDHSLFMPGGGGGWQE